MKSRFKNVYWHPGISKWTAKVKVNYKSHHLGSFDTEELASDAAIQFKVQRGISGNDGCHLPLKSAFEYRDGSLYAKLPSSYVKTGDLVGSLCPNHGYVHVGHGGRVHRAHHIVWLMFNNTVPSGMEIDHINGNRSDNRIENLRLVTKAENTRNRKIPKNNSSGEIGVQRMPSGNFQVRVGRERVGTFSTMEKARSARNAVAQKNGYHQNHGRAA